MLPGTVLFPAMDRLLLIIRYAWAAPASALGLLLAAVALCLGATCRVVNGVVEVAGGRFTRLFPLLPRVFHFEAITFGHVVIGLDHSLLAHLRTHEHAHVRQYERWGLLLIPLYLGSSAVQKLRGRNPYLNNRFEIEAFAKAAASPGGAHASVGKTDTNV
ncbi:hypothetical protein [Geobacter hydrogenophilus]|uniref:hypothetical protein n=1 Tax=Geobacter hydrogenophilus TaxID=40983 RepID=UPI00248FA4E3|nr:hypothetical protein [Geobacter hydrogenophilus]